MQGRKSEIKNQIKNKDINQYRTLEEVDDAINAAFAQRETTARNKQEEFKKTVKIDTEVLGMIDTTPNEVNPKYDENSQGDLYFQNDKIIIVCPHDKAHSELYGRNPDPTCRGDRPSYWCTSTPGMRYFDSYWGTQGNTLFYILPKSVNSVLYDPEPGHEDRFTKVALRVTSDNKIAEIRDRFNQMVEEPKWSELCRLWGITLK